jgi:hypothetical protein
MAKNNKKRQTRTPAAPEPVSSPVASSAAAARPGSRSSESEFKPDYSQTLKDLRRIGILAGTFFSVLIVLAFILR